MIQMMYNLMYRNIQPSEINKMTFGEMEFWNHGHELIKHGKKDPKKAGPAPVMRKRK